MASWLDAIFGRIFSAGTDVGVSSALDFKAPLTASLNHTTGRIDIKLPDESITPASLAPATDTVTAGVKFAPTFVLIVPLVAGVTGTGDDVVAFNANAPFAFRILDVWAEVTTGVAASTLRLWRLAGESGGAYSDAIDSGTSDTRPRDEGTTGSHGVALNGSLHVHRSDRAVAGTVYILCCAE